MFVAVVGFHAWTSWLAPVKPEMTPWPPVTFVRAVELTFQGPPTSAVPNPLATVRSNWSLTITDEAAGVAERSFERAPSPTELTALTS